MLAQRLRRWHNIKTSLFQRVGIAGKMSNALCGNRPVPDFCVVQHWSTVKHVAFNPLNPHDALKHHFASLKNDLISWNLVILERKLSWNCLNET